MIFTSEMSVSIVQNIGSDITIASAAWVSTSSEDGLKRAREKPDDVKGVVNYLMKHKHGTPFEHNLMTFCINAPIFVWREFHRHRIGFSYSEESGRYKQLAPVFYIPPKDRPMFKVDDWKPGKPKFLGILNQVGESAFQKLCSNLKDSYVVAYKKYEENIGLGIDPGLARDCLPVGIFSFCWVTCNARSFMNFLSLRTHEETAKHISYPLYEIEVVARKCEEFFSGIFPITYKAFNDNGRVAP